MKYNDLHEAYWQAPEAVMGFVKTADSLRKFNDKLLIKDIKWSHIGYFYGTTIVKVTDKKTGNKKEKRLTVYIISKTIDNGMTWTVLNKRK